MDTIQKYVQERCIMLAEKNVATLGHLLRGLSHTDVTTFRDGAEGWTALEIVCHLRDFDEIFLQRARSMIDQDAPTFTSYDVDLMAKDRAYNSHDLTQALAELSTNRQALMAFFKAATGDQWSRVGLHPIYGEMTLLHQLVQIGTHDAGHLEQITRVLAQRFD